PRRPVIMRR
nr:Chain B, Heliocin [Heliothis virescens]